ncbi:MAG: hypothetical protein HQL31_02515 [Planctomycetes bacterium]|nr:hypothetical protein [Planctomycetota bacterium]
MSLADKIEQLRKWLKVEVVGEWIKKRGYEFIYPHLAKIRTDLKILNRVRVFSCFSNFHDPQDANAHLAISPRACGRLNRFVMVGDMTGLTFSVMDKVFEFYDHQPLIPRVAEKTVEYLARGTYGSVKAMANATGVPSFNIHKYRYQERIPVDFKMTLKMADYLKVEILVES